MLHSGKIKHTWGWSPIQNLPGIFISVSFVSAHDGICPFTLRTSTEPFRPNGKGSSFSKVKTWRLSTEMQFVWAHNISISHYWDYQLTFSSLCALTFVMFLIPLRCNLTFSPVNYLLITWLMNILLTCGFHMPLLLWHLYPLPVLWQEKSDLYCLMENMFRLSEPGCSNGRLFHLESQNQGSNNNGKAFGIYTFP